MTWVPVFLTLASLAFVAVFVLLIVVTLYMSKKHARRLSGEVCPQCMYPRQGSASDACPECGHAWGPGTRARTPLWIELSILVVFFLVFSFVIPALVILAFAFVAV